VVLRQKDGDSQKMMGKREELKCRRKGRRAGAADAVGHLTGLMHSKG